MGQDNKTGVFMKRTVFLVLALFALMAVGVYAQTEADFEVVKSEDGKSITIIRYKGTAKDVKIPEKIQNLPVTSINGFSFDEIKNITSVTIPNGVTSIGESAFAKCTSLTSVTIPNSVKSIGNSAFSGCASLTSVTIPDGVTSIGKSTFQSCTKLASVTIPNSVTSIGNTAFQECKSLTSVTIPNGVTSIGDTAFQLCTSLTSVTIPNSVTSIGQIAFRGCTSLTSVVIPNGVTGIFNQAFQNCTSLTSVTIGSGVTTIGTNAFQNCPKLTSVTFAGSIPSSGFRTDPFTGLGDIRDKYLATGGGAGTYTRPADGTAWTKVGAASSATTPAANTQFNPESDFTVTAVSGGISITKYKGSSPIVNIPEKIQNKPVIEIGGRVFYNDKTWEGMNVTSVTIPSSVKTLGIEAFYGCTKLASVTIPNSVTMIDSTAFQDCTGLKSITIPASVTRIKSSAFSDSGLTSVTFQGTIASNDFDTDAFDGDLRAKFYATDKSKGTPGTYTRPDSTSTTWTKK
jgi:hypothetical protein